MISVDIDAFDLGDLAEDLRRAPDRVDEKVRRAVKANERDVVRTAKRDAPVRTPPPTDPRKPPGGHLRKSISADRDSDGMGYEAGPTADYGRHVEFGTRPHEISMKPGGPMLYFPDVHDVWHLRERVWHPGTSPQPYMLPSFDRHLPEFVDELGDIVERIL
ncbi:bacteriophage HK97-gp10 putative tail-component [Actinocorallia herbida]|uniref:Bacteriophage HK97-gp10 putative tail-component n=1 Tax=Actinocorallia herbida TaxID=58109 RepID=A0A3N1CMN4_9ACTN|nr:HK97 gp10 family phage protein [Actinocorallia herbida]ROO82581.1 bacteriophage HK97-gp10 putative tail-component [Actinocorallia herbida]